MRDQVSEARNLAQSDTHAHRQPNTVIVIVTIAVAITQVRVVYPLPVVSWILYARARATPCEVCQAPPG